MGPRTHDRFDTVRRAKGKLLDRLDALQIELSMPDAEWLILTTTVMVNIVRSIAKQDLQPLNTPHAQLAAAVATAQQEFGLTDIELLGLLAAHQHEVTRYILRAERHPSASAGGEGRCSTRTCCTRHSTRPTT